MTWFAPLCCVALPDRWLENLHWFSSDSKLSCSFLAYYTECVSLKVGQISLCDLCSFSAAFLCFVPDSLRPSPSSAQFSAGEQRGPARRRLSHLPISGEGADQTLQRPQLFPSGRRHISTLTHVQRHLKHSLLPAIMKCKSKVRKSA